MHRNSTDICRSRGYGPVLTDTCGNIEIRICHCESGAGANGLAALGLLLILGLSCRAGICLEHCNDLSVCSRHVEEICCTAIRINDGIVCSDDILLLLCRLLGTVRILFRCVFDIEFSELVSGCRIDYDRYPVLILCSRLSSLSGRIDIEDLDCSSDSRCRLAALCHPILICDSPGVVGVLLFLGHIHAGISGTALTDFFLLLYREGRLAHEYELRTDKRAVFDVI